MTNFAKVAAVCLWVALAGLLAAPASGQVAVLADSTHSLTVTLAAAPATTQANYLVSWSGTGGPADAVGASTGTTAATMLAGVAGGSRNAEVVHVFNADTAAITAHVAKVVSGTSSRVVSATIPVGGTLRWSRTEGVKVLDAQGVVATAAVGTVNGTGVAVAEAGAGRFRTSTFTFTAAPLTLRDTTAPAQGGGQKIYDFPDGRVFVLGSTGTLTFTTTSATTTLNASIACGWGVGTVTQANVTLATTEQNLLPVTTFTSSATANTVNTATSGALAAAAQFDGTTTPVDAFLNVSVPTATDIDGDATIAINGTVTITWVLLGDF